MAQEIERKFLVKDGIDPAMLGTTVRITQGYLCRVPQRTVRVRIKGDQGFLTIKGESSANGLTRYEWEKEIRLDDAQELLQLCEAGIIDKWRTEVRVGKHIFEVDQFLGENAGLLLAEVELAFEDEPLILPDWLGKEVTGDERYYNSYLAQYPFGKWSGQE